MRIARLLLRRKNLASILEALTCQHCGHGLWKPSSGKIKLVNSFFSCPWFSGALSFSLATTVTELVSVPIEKQPYKVAAKADFGPKKQKYSLVRCSPGNLKRGNMKELFIFVVGALAGSGGIIIADAYVPIHSRPAPPPIVLRVEVPPHVNPSQIAVERDRNFKPGKKVGK